MDIRMHTVRVCPPGIPNKGPFEGSFTCKCGKEHRVRVIGYSHDLNRQVELFDHYGDPEGPTIRYDADREGFKWAIHFPNDEPYVHVPTEAAAREFCVGWYEVRNDRKKLKEDV